MTGQQVFADDFMGWCLALGFIVVIVIICALWTLAVNNKLRSPLTPLVRSFERHQKHRQEMAKLKWRADCARHGIDPEYIKVMEREVLP